MSNSTNSAERLAGHAIAADAAIVARASIVIHATPERVWAVLTTISSWPSWNAAIPKAHVHGAVVPSSSFVWRTGGATIRSTLHTVEPTRAFGWTGRTFGLSAIHNWTITPIEEGVRVDVAESMDGLWARWFRNAFQKDLDKGMQHWLQALKKVCEV
jgi:uncharacterized protein YndB with AHSA1/START domain